MNANKRGVFVAVVAAVTMSGIAFAAPLDARSNSKINSSMAKKWGGTDNTPAINPAQQDKRIVNYGSKKDNTCNVNVGTVQGKAKPGQRAPKEIVVTTKDVINICK